MGELIVVVLFVAGAYFLYRKKKNKGGNTDSHPTPPNRDSDDTRDEK